MYCTKCGNKHIENEKFCSSCGGKLFSKTLDKSPKASDATAVSNNSVALPQSLQGWNWGAAGLTWIWGLSNRVWISLLVIVPVINLFWWIVLGINGNKWAWQAGGYKKGEKAFEKQQHSWKIIGIIIFFLAPIAYFGILSSIGTVALNGARELARDAQREADISIFRIVQVLYYDDQGHYYISSTPIEIDYDHVNKGFYNAIIDGDYIGEWLEAPTVEASGSDYNYWYVSTDSGDHYALYTKLEENGNFYVITDSDDAREQTHKPSCSSTECN
ncbi:MAG: zinc ribbon domain-containing protein [Candidatus Gottesmanbacteria bacterium]